MRRKFTANLAERRTSRNYACSVCQERWPEKQIQVQDGIETDRRCPNCYEPNGGALARDLDRAAVEGVAASITAQYAMPPKFPQSFDPWSEARVIDDFDPAPLRLTPGGGPKALTINGQQFSSDDTIIYGHAELSDNDPPELTPVAYDDDGNALAPYRDTLVLSVVASPAVPPGLYSLTYQGSIYYGVFDVRS